jgi:hypothetical protein
MLRRLFFGVGEGLAVALVVVLALRGLGADWSRSGVVYGASPAAGVLVGLVAGRPVWTPGAKLEALVKSIIGAFIAATTMFGVRKWLPHVKVDLAALGAGVLGDVPAASIPIVTCALALVFEMDDAFGPRVHVPAEPPKAQLPLSEPPPSSEHHVDQSSARRRPSRRE